MLYFLVKPDYLVFVWEKMCKGLGLFQHIDEGFPWNEDTNSYYITEIYICITEILKQASPQLKDRIMQFINRTKSMIRL